LLILNYTLYKILIDSFGEDFFVLNHFLQLELSSLFFWLNPKETKNQGLINNLLNLYSHHVKLKDSPTVQAVTILSLIRNGLKRTFNRPETDVRMIFCFQ
jgi:hypothetical protein